METIQFVTRRPWTKTIADGKSESFIVGGDYFFIHELVTIATGDDAEITMAVNDLSEADSAPVRVNESLQGVPGARHIKKLTFWNRSGSPVRIIVVHGLGQRFTTSRTTVKGSMTLDAASIDDLSTAIAAKQAVPVKGVPYLSTVEPGETKTFDDFAGISILNTGTDNIEIAGVEFTPGNGMDWNANGRFDTLGPLVIKGLVAGQALVSRVGGTVS